METSHQYLATNGMLSCLLAAALLQASPGDIFLPSVPLREALPRSDWYGSSVNKTLVPELLPTHPDFPGARRDQALTGTLVDPSGRPMVGVIVGAVSLGPSAPPLDLTVKERHGLGWQIGKRSSMRSLGFTDSDGAFRITGLWPGRHQIYAVMADSPRQPLIPLQPAIVEAKAPPLRAGRYQVGRSTPGSTHGSTSGPDLLGAHGDFIGDLLRGGPRPKPRKGDARIRVLLREPGGAFYCMPADVELFRSSPEDDGQYVPWETQAHLNLASGSVIQRDLLPSKYRMVIWNRESFFGTCGAAPPPMVPWLLPAVCEFEVRANEVQSIEATFGEAGRVRLAFSDIPGVAPSVNPPIDPKAEDYLDRLVNALHSPSTPRKVRVYYERHPGGKKEPLRQHVPGARGWTSEFYLPGAVAVGDDLLAPGRYRLTFKVDGATIDPCWIDVAHGMATDVTRTLKAR